MIKPKILVTSAAGRTGAAAVQQLLEKDYPVRAFVRRWDTRADALHKAGAEVVTGNQFDLRDLRKALHGVQRAYHCPPLATNLLHNTMLFAIAAEEAKLEAVALMSGWNPHPTHPSVVTREHWIANQLYRWMPSVDVIHVNPGLFAFVYLLGLPAIMHMGIFVAPFGEGRNAPPSSEDIARVAVGVLTDPAPHIGKCYRPTGPDLLSPYDVAGILSRIVGRKVKYRNVPIKMFAKAATAQGFPLLETSQVRYYAEELQRGVFEIGAPTDHVESVTGQKPEKFESIARRYIQRPELIHPSLRIGSRFDVLAFMVKMMLTSVPELHQWERERGHPLLTDPVLAQDSPEWRTTAEQRLLNLLPISRKYGDQA
ncbi:MAG: NmrA family NAD(P)-binding protein [Nitrospirae bacterium]|nr:NmrA family NAD(P)-binding protein [Nitrospirota bacterium]